MAQQLPPQQNVGGGGPQWANPDGASQQQIGIPGGLQGSVQTAQQHEEEFFAPLSTLDEPVMETIMRDVRSVGSKLKVVLLPMERSVSSYCVATYTISYPCCQCPHTAVVVYIYIYIYMTFNLFPFNVRT